MGMRWGTALIAALMASGCSGGHEVDREAWLDDISPYMDVVDTDSFSRYQDAWIERCDSMDADTFALFVAVGLDEGTDPGHLRVDVTHACPDRLGELDETLDLVGH